jgi:hypothetical protein
VQPTSDQVEDDHHNVTEQEQLVGSVPQGSEGPKGEDRKEDDRDDSLWWVSELVCWQAMMHIN